MTYCSTFPRSALRIAVTLIELMIVLAIIGVLIQLLLPAIQASREASRRAACQSNLRQVGVAIQNYESAHRALPTGGYTEYRGTWMIAVLPYVEEAEAARDFFRDQVQDDSYKTERYDADVNLPVTSAFYSIFLCPSDEKKRNVFPQPDTGQFHGEVSKHSYVVNFGNTAIDKGPKKGGVKTNTVVAVPEYQGVHFGVGTIRRGDLG